VIMMKNDYCNLAQPLQQHPCRFAQGSGCKPSPSPKHDGLRPEDPKSSKLLNKLWSYAEFVKPNTYDLLKESHRNESPAPSTNSTPPDTTQRG
jgi:hypothetical protein